MRNLRTHAVESERSRISRDLHDGILQTLLSLNIQLDVLRARVAQDPEKARAEIGKPAEDRPAGERGTPPHGHRYAARCASKARICAN